MAEIEIVAVGTELLLGQLVDTNTAFIAQRLAEGASTCTQRMLSATTANVSLR